MRALAAGWLILAVWAALGVLLGVLTRGTSLAIGVGILYALVIEGLLSNLSALEPVTSIFLRANGYSIATALGTSARDIEASGPAPSGDRSSAACRRSLVLAAFIAGFAALSALLLRRRDVA